MRYGAARPRGHRGRGSARIRCVTPSRTILLTGATGYVGGQLLPRLLAEGHDVRCLVRDVGRARAAIGDDRVALVAGDVLDGRGPLALGGGRGPRGGGRGGGGGGRGLPLLPRAREGGGGGRFRPPRPRG